MPRVIDNDPTFPCSECGKGISHRDIIEGDGTCPHCGAEFAEGEIEE